MRRITWSLVGLALLVSCGQNGTTTASAPASSGADSPASSASPTLATDPLVGEWRQDFSCEDHVKTFHRLALIDYDEAFYRRWARDFAWGPNAEIAQALTPEALCKGAPDESVVMKVDDGIMVRFPTLGAQSNPATYELLNDHTFTLNDGGLDIADCDSSGCTAATYRYTFKIVGERLTIVLHHDPLDPWGGTPFEVAPFYRVS